MINVSEATKVAWATGVIDKDIKINVGGTVITADRIVGGSFALNESIMASDSLEFVGCIAKNCSFQTDALNNVNLKGKTCSVQIRAGLTDWITVFTGTIDESKKRGSKGLKDITAYDVFYRLSQTDACDWWNSLSVTTLIAAFKQFMTDFNVAYNSAAISFVNSGITCFGGSKRQAKKLTALQFLQAVCQINGCVGYTDGYGRFGVKYIDAIAQQRLYPADSLFPSDFIYPSDYDGGSVGFSTIIPYYQELEYEDYSIKQIDKVTLRNKSEDVGVSYPYAGSNNYIIQGNIFAFDQSGSDLLDIAQSIYNVVKNANFRPFTGKQMSFPWLEAGDKVTYYDINDQGVTVEVNFIIMSRKMNGDQMMWDTYSAEGEQDQRIFITDLQAQINDLQEQINENAEDTPNGSLFGMVAVEYTQPIETPTIGGYEASVSGIATEVT